VPACKGAGMSRRRARSNNCHFYFLFLVVCFGRAILGGRRVSVCDCTTSALSIGRKLVPPQQLWMDHTDSVTFVKLASSIELGAPWTSACTSTAPRRSSTCSRTRLENITKGTRLVLDQCDCTGSVQEKMICDLGDHGRVRR
jgi:hypothetical protein